MRIVTKLFDSDIELNENDVLELVIENHRVLYSLLSDIYDQIQGYEGDTILAENDEIIKISKKIELITNYIPFELNEKRLITKLQAMLEKEAVNTDNFEKTMGLLADIERYIYGLSEVLPYELDFSGINISALIKMCGLTIVDDSISVIERIYNYMNIVRDLLGERLFIFANIRSYFNDNDLQSFIDTVLLHKFNVLLIDHSDGKKLNGMRKIIVDNDLCVI